MNDFIQKWRTDSKFKAKVQLGFYTIFIIITIIFVSMSRNSINYNNSFFEETEEESTIIKIPENYQYSIKINLNNTEYSYEGNKTTEEEIIVKTVDEETNNYIKKGNTYYKDIIMTNNIVAKEEVYDIIDYSYLNLNTINQYLLISKKEKNQYLVYLNDIILGHDSEKYIIIEIEENIINIDYTSLLQIFDSTTENCNIEYIIKEIE